MIKIILRMVFLGLFWTGSGVANAGAINHNVWYQFSFDTSNSTSNSVFATGCDPADPSGLSCTPSSGTSTEFADAQPWAFTVGLGGATLIVTDAFYADEHFEVFNFTSSLGLTPDVVAYDDTLNPVDCGDDPEVCLATPGMSFASFILGAGDYSLTISVFDAPWEVGSAYFKVESANVNAIPSPGALALILPGLLGVWLMHRKRSASS